MSEFIDLYRQGVLELEEPVPSWPEMAQEVVQGARQKSYAHPLLNFLRIAIEWSNWLMGRGKLTYGKAVDPDDVVWMMVLLKIPGREVNGHSDDNGIDNIGYTFCWQRLDHAMKQLGFEQGMAWYQGKAIWELQALLEDLTRR